MSCELSHAIQLSVSESALEDNVSTLNIVQFGKALSQRVEDWTRPVIRNYPDARKLGFLGLR